MPRVETAAEIAVGDRLSGARSVDETTVARIDADVIDAMPAEVEEDEVPWRKLRERHRVRGTLLLAAVRGMASPTRSCTYTASPLQSKPAPSAPPK